MKRRTNVQDLEKDGISVPERVLCPICCGSGLADEEWPVKADGYYICENCLGEGWVRLQSLTSC